jgi:hypothetical protein
MFGIHKDPRSTAGVSSVRSGSNESCNEEAFHYFLTIQRQRSERSGRPFSLLIVELKGQAGQSVSINDMIATKVFNALRRCLRDTDILGWYRTGWAAGAILTELGDHSPTDAGRPVGQRAKATIAGEISEEVTCRLDVTVYQLRSTLRT